MFSLSLILPVNHTQSKCVQHTVNLAETQKTPTLQSDQLQYDFFFPFYEGCQPALRSNNDTYVDGSNK